MKRIIALLLLAIMVSTAFAACGNDPAESAAPSDTESQVSEASVNTDPEAEWKNAEGEWTPKGEVKDLTGKTFHIIVKGKGNNPTYQSDDFTYGEESSGLYGEVLDSAVIERNRMVEQVYHVTLEVSKVDDYVTAINNDLATKGGEYDAIMPTLKDLAVLASQGQLVELTSLDSIDVSAPWYDQEANKAFSVKNKVYFTTGDITILNKVCTPSVIFGKDLVESHRLEDPYTLVKEKKWTFDKMIEMGQAVSDVSSTDAYQNTYGLLAAYGDTFDLFGAAGEMICVKDADDIPIRSIANNNSRSITIAQKILEVYANGDSWMVFSNDRTKFSSFTDALNIFSQGKALFRISAFSATTKLRSSSLTPFGILPMPLMDETQTDYVSYCGSSNDVAGVAVPTSAKDPEFSAYMIDVYSAYAKRYVTPAYVRVNLYQKDAYDQESEDMLDLIFDNIVYDIGECFDFGKISSVFTTLAGQRQTAIVSALESVVGKADQEIADLVSNYN